MTAQVERLLVAALDAEWAVQTGRSQALVTSRFVREALELAAAGAPEGIFGIAGELHSGGDTPEMLVHRLRDRLPATPDPRTLRILERMCALPARSEPPQLPAPDLVMALEEPPEPVEPPIAHLGAFALIGSAAAEGSRRGQRIAVGSAGVAAVALGVAALLTGDALLGTVAVAALPGSRARPDEGAEA